MANSQELGSCAIEIYSALKISKQPELSKSQFNATTPKKLEIKYCTIKKEALRNKNESNPLMYLYISSKSPTLLA
jgi:hypothetical protein